MDLKIRRIFFYCLTAVFVLLGAYLLITAQGWVLDLKNLKIVKTGSLFLKYVPADAALEINGKETNASPGLISSGVLISRLVPGEYRIKVSEPDYFPWEKKLAVGEAVVTAVSQIKLWPQIWSFKEVSTSSLVNFWLTGEGAILQLKDNTLRWDGRVLRGQRLVLSDPDHGSVITGDGKNYFLTDLGNPKTATNLTELFDSLEQGQSTSTKAEVIKNFFFHPFNGNKMLISTENTLYSLDLKRITLDKLTSAKGITGVSMSGNEIFVKDVKGNLIIFNLLLQTTNAYELGAPANSTMKASPGGSFLFFLKSDGELLIYDRSLKKLETLEKNVSDLYISPDERRLALISKNGDMSIEALDNYYADGDVKKGDKWEIALNGGDMRDLEWLNINSNYGLILNGEKLSVTELDSRTPQNTYPVLDGVKKMIIQGNNLYILKTDGTLSEVVLK